LSEHDVVNEFDRREDIYRKIREHAQLYWACQLGLTCFAYSSATNSYIARPFNFWLFPNSNRRNLTFMPSCVDFLARSGFDFNKLILEGIPYDKLSAPPATRESTFCYMSSTASSMKLDELLTKVKEFVTAPLKKIELDTGDVHMRKSFIKKFDRTFRGLGCKINKARPTILTINKTGKRPPAIVEAEETKHEDAGVEESLGVEEVIKLMLQTRKPLVAHNMLYDLMFLYQQFIDDLPASYAEFKRLARHTLPPLYDTKFIPKHISSLQIRNTGLIKLLEALKQKDCLDVAVDLEAGFTKYRGETNYHEAGYDSYVTGEIFAKMAHLVRAEREADDIWAGLADCAGKVPLFGAHYRALELYSEETDDVGCFANLLRVTSSLQTDELARELREFGDVKVVKIGVESYIVHFPRLDEFVSSISEVIESLNRTQIITASIFRE
jgi:poly(A)-specific ribonuclease